MAGGNPITPTDAEEVFQAAKTLPPDERLRLAMRLWGSLPPDYWAAPSSAELAEAFYRVNEVDAGRSADSPWEIVQMALEYRMRRPSPKLYSAPRRFDLATILVVMAAFSVVMGILRVIQLPPMMILFVAALLTFVAIGQAVLFDGRMPRLASALVGAIGGGVLRIGAGLFLPAAPIGAPFWLGPLPFVIMVGTVAGYIAGVVVGAIFHSAEVLRKKLNGETSTESEPIERPRFPYRPPVADAPDP